MFNIISISNFITMLFDEVMLSPVCFRVVGDVGIIVHCEGSLEIREDVPSPARYERLGAAMYSPFTRWRIDRSSGRLG